MLDNCEHVIAAAAEVAEDLLRRCPGLRLLATSREGCASAARPSGPCRRSRPTTPSSSSSTRPGGRRAIELVRRPPRRAIADICARLDGLPLAIELAAPHPGVPDHADRRSAQRPVPPADRWVSHGAAAPADAARRRRLELRAALRRRAARLRTAVGVPRRLRPATAEAVCADDAPRRRRRRRPPPRARRQVAGGRRPRAGDGDCGSRSSRPWPSTAGSGSPSAATPCASATPWRPLRPAVRAERRRVHRRPAAGLADGDRPGARQPPGGARLGRRQRRRRDGADDRRRRQPGRTGSPAWWSRAGAGSTTPSPAAGERRRAHAGAGADGPGPARLPRRRARALRRRPGRRARDLRTPRTTSSRWRWRTRSTPSRPAVLGDLDEARRRRLVVLDFYGRVTRTTRSTWPPVRTRWRSWPSSTATSSAAERHYRAATDGFGRARPAGHELDVPRHGRRLRRAGRRLPGRDRALERRSRPTSPCSAASPDRSRPASDGCCSTTVNSSAAEAVYQGPRLGPPGAPHVVIFQAQAGLAALHRSTGATTQPSRPPPRRWSSTGPTGSAGSGTASTPTPTCRPPPPSAARCSPRSPPNGTNRSSGHAARARPTACGAESGVDPAFQRRPRAGRRRPGLSRRSTPPSSEAARPGRPQPDQRGSRSAPSWMVLSSPHGGAHPRRTP